MKHFEIPELNVVRFEATDVITTSDPTTPVTEATAVTTPEDEF